MTLMKQTPLNQLTIVSAGQAAPKDDEFSDHGLPFVRAGSLDGLLAGKSESDLELVSEETAKLRKLKAYPKGTILFAKSGMSATKDRIYVLQNPAYVVSHLATLLPNGSTHTDYLRLALKHFPPSVLIKDSAYPSISLGDIQSYEIPVPLKYETQILIAHLLKKVEGLIEQRKKHLQQLDELLKSAFLQMFGDPTKNEKNWDHEYLGKLTCEKIGYGIVQPGIPVEDGIPTIRVGDFIGTRIDTDNVEKVSTEISKKHKNSVLKGDEILLACVGATIGKVAAVEPIHVGYNIVRATARIRVSTRINRLFLLHFLLSGFAKDYYIKVTRSVGQPTLNIKQIEEIPVITPPIELQNRFSIFVEKSEILKTHYQKALSDLEDLYGTLSQKVFKGELDLSHVPMPSIETEDDKAVVTEPLHPLTDQGPEFKLPDSGQIPSALENAEERNALLSQWLEAYCNQLHSTPFSLQYFMTAAQARLAELHPDKDFELGANDYEHIKAWLFKALADGRLRQVRNITSHDDEEIPVFGNQIELKAVQP